MNFDISQYDKLRTNDGIQLHKVGEVAVVFLRKFDPNTGQELMPDMGPIRLEELLSVEAQLTRQLGNIALLKSDMRSLGVPTELPKPDA